MDKKLEEAIKILEYFITEFDEEEVSFTQVEKAIKTVLNYIENSISKEEYNKIKEENEEYKKQSWENEITNLIYKNLRKCFNNMVDRILGEKYYNMGMDTYTCDKLTCEDIINKKVKIIFKDNNSISKEVIKEKIEEVRKMKFEDERLNGATIDFAACKFEEILEGK